MADNSILPKAQSALVDGAGRPTRAFYDFFRKLANGVQGQIDALAGIVATLSKVVASLGGGSGGEIIDVTAAIDAKADKATNVYGAGSLTGGGNLYSDQYLSLRGDVEAPPAISFYGVLDTAEGRGWQPLSANFATLDDGAGNLSLDLAMVPDAGGGTLLRFVRDAWGRITGTSAATTTDLPEGSNLYFTDVRADARIPPGYIDGLQMQWVSGTALTVTSGAAYIQGAGTVLRAPTAIAKAGLSLTASTWYHVYLYSSAGMPDVEIVTTAPAAAYNGTARSKTGDAGRRYVGSVLTDASGAVNRFLHVTPGTIFYNINTNAVPFLVVNAGTSTTAATVSLSGVAPLTAIAAKLTALNAATNAYVRISNSNGPDAALGYISVASPGGVSVMDIPLDALQAYTYAYDGPPNNATFQRVFGYVYGR